MFLNITEGLLCFFLRFKKIEKTDKLLYLDIFLKYCENFPSFFSDIFVRKKFHRFCRFFTKKMYFYNNKKINKSRIVIIYLNI